MEVAACCKMLSFENLVISSAISVSRIRDSADCIPYIYLTNIGDVVYRIRKRKFKYKFFEYLNRIGIALVIWLAILIILSITTLK